WNEKTASADQTDTVYRVQVGAFHSRQNAEQLQQDLYEKGYPAIIQKN
ncbi:MAG TPA: SPOR domain-containing protein, partial [Firmicutes bacterium]|nr:SPOR domain-containing protein [Bacillota bacterium]